MFCSDCGSRIPLNGNFCPVCGMKVSIEEKSPICEELTHVGEIIREVPIKRDYSPYEYNLYGKKFVIDKLIVLSSQNHMLYWNIGKVYTDKFIEEFISCLEPEKRIGLITRVVDDSESAAAQIVINKYEQEKDYTHSKKMIIDRVSTLLKAPQMVKDLFDEIMRVIQLRDNDRVRRKVAKENRFKVQGGGFGIAGAAKGIITAEAINATTGIVYSIFNSGEKEERKYRAMINQLLNKNYQSLVEAVLEDCVTFCDVDKNASVLFFHHRQRAMTIYNRLVSGEIASEKMTEAFISMISIYPANPKFYEWALKNIGDSNGELLRLMENLNIQMREEIV